MNGPRRFPLFVSRIPIFVLLLSLAGCATSYRPRNIFGAGYTEERLGPDQWFVTFDASAFTPRERVENYLLLRCAELSAGNGANFFVLVDEGIGGEAARIRPSLIDKPSFQMEAPAREAASDSIRSARAVIRVYKTKPEEVGTVYDAREVIARFASQRHQ